MGSISPISSIRATSWRLWNLGTVLKGFRKLGIKALLLVDVMVGLWLAATYIYVFHALSSGGTVGEPDSIIAKTELWLSIAVTCWFLWQVPYWLLRLLKQPKSAESISKES
jgi:hypothetical protein